jgi:hypothetical protein
MGERCRKWAWKRDLDREATASLCNTSPSRIVLKPGRRIALKPEAASKELRFTNSDT